MKYVEANITSNYKFNDEITIVSHPTEGVPCIKVGDKYYSPSIIWLEYQPDSDTDASEVLSADLDSEPNGVWVELDEDEEEDLISEVYDEYVEFRELSSEEISDLEEEEEE